MDKNLRELCERLCDAVDAVGIRLFEEQDGKSDFTTMLNATLPVRAALRQPEAQDLPFPESGKIIGWRKDGARTIYQCQTASGSVIDFVRADEKPEAQGAGVPEGFKWQLVPNYPEGDVVGPCICGSWPGGKCFKCPVIDVAPKPEEPRNG